MQQQQLLFCFSFNFPFVLLKNYRRFVNATHFITQKYSFHFKLTSHIIISVSFNGFVTKTHFKQFLTIIILYWCYWFSRKIWNCVIFMNRITKTNKRRNIFSLDILRLITNSMRIIAQKRNRFTQETLNFEQKQTFKIYL